MNKLRSRLFCKDEELNGTSIPLVGSPIVDSSASLEASDVGGEVKCDHRIRVDADAVLDGLATDFQRTTLCVLVDANLAPVGSSELPFQVRQFPFACRGDQTWFRPVGPIGGEGITRITYDQIQFLGAGHIDINVDGVSRRQCIDHFGLPDGILSHGLRAEYTNQGKAVQ